MPLGRSTVSPDDRHVAPGSAGFLRLQGPAVPSSGGYISGPAAYKALASPDTRLSLVRYTPTGHMTCSIEHVVLNRQALAKERVLSVYRGMTEQ